MRKISIIAFVMLLPGLQNNDQSEVQARFNTLSIDWSGKGVGGNRHTGERS